MSWEVFTKKVIRTGQPTVTLGKMGRVSFNMNATAAFSETNAKFVVLLWDKETRRCAAKVALSTDEGAYRITYNSKYNGSGFSAVTFLNYIRYDWRETRAFNADWDDVAKMFVFSIPAQYFGTAGDLTTPLGKLKRADRMKAGVNDGFEEAKALNTEKEVPEGTS